MKTNLIYASDIDDTLLFPKSVACIPEAELISVTNSNEKPLALSLRAFEILQKINEMATFIPVTSRSIEQYVRINLFKDEIKPRFAIVTNGATLFVDGVISKEYQEYFLAHVGEKAFMYKKIVEQFLAQFPKELVERVRWVDETFCLINVVSDKNEDQDVLSVAQKCLPQNSDCSLSLQRKKLYILPDYVNKMRAVDYVVERYGLTLAVAAGDAVMDDAMLKAAHKGIVPATGELFRVQGKKALENQGLHVVEGSSPLEIGEKVLKQGYESLVAVV